MLYESWPGNNKIYCQGRLITGPDSAPFWIAELLIAGPTLLFWIFCCVPFWKEEVFGPIVFFISIFLTALLVYCHFAASFTEPGIIPRSNEPIPENLTRQEVINGKEEIIQFCKTCRVWRPPRAHHCRDCDNCILEFDHHCPWVGNCVGKRNYRWFNLFLWFVIIDCVFIATICILQVGLRVASTGKPWGEVLVGSPFNIGITAFTAFIFFTVMGLCGYHCSLICSGKTTYESIKKIEGDQMQTFCGYRFYSVLCGPAFPSLIDLRSPVSEEQVLFIPRDAIHHDDPLSSEDSSSDSCEK